MPYKNKNNRVARDKLRREKNRLACLEILGKQCARCGYSDIRALAIDHVNGGGRREMREFGGSLYINILEKLMAGSSEYQTLCFNCNYIKEHESGFSRLKAAKGAAKAPAVDALSVCDDL